ncbi:MAG: TIM-barrel domain-containing protein, partial [Polyangia bacterium]
MALLPGCEGVPGPVATPKLHTPRWAFRPWISKDISTTDDSYGFVGGFRDRGIPVGTLVLDSPWETDYNTFVPNPVRYHDFGKLVSDLGADHVRLVLWTTQMMNNFSYDLEVGGDTYPMDHVLYDEGLKKHYFVDDGMPWLWWKGAGAGLDFFNPSARAWWHELQNGVLDQGISGWKLDFGEEYITEDTIRTKAGPVAHQAYSEAYYRDFLGYGVGRKGADDFVTMVRAYDASYQFSGRFFAAKDTAPVVWVGDNRRDFVGLADALDETFRSAVAGYQVIGSDIGGYLDVDDKDVTTAIPFDAEVFLRWLAVGAMSPFMELHGRANLEPWNLPVRSDDAVVAYRYWATLHDALVPYYYSLTEDAYAGTGGNLIVPEGDEASWPGDYRFSVGPAFFIAPFLDGTGTRSVTLPSGARYFDWWDDGAAVLEAGSTVTRSYVGDAIKIPLFLREGSIVPLDGEKPGAGMSAAYATTLGLPLPGGALVLLVTPADTTTTFTLHDVAGDATLAVSRTAGAITF